MSQQTRPRLAIDIGGTFTDVAVEHGDTYLTSKILTTAHNPVEGVLHGAEIALASAAMTPGDIGAIIHGTTLATNALIERRGATVGAIVTEGFRDILEIAYERRYDQYDMYLENPDRIVPRERVRTVNERMTATGPGVLRPRWAIPTGDGCGCPGRLSASGYLRRRTFEARPPASQRSHRTRDWQPTQR